MSEAFLEPAEVAELTGFSERLERFAWNVAPMARWQQLILPGDSIAYDRHAHCPFDGSGIYALFNEVDQLLYIGKSHCVHQRLNSHYTAARFGRGPDYASFACLPLSIATYSDVEIAHIHALRPPLNVLYEPPKWPGHAAMVTAIQKEWEPLS
jgi:hypothetical protein